MKAVALYEELAGETISVPAELTDEGYGEDMVKSAMLGFINLGDSEFAMQETSVSKQDFISILYKAIVHYDQSFALRGEEADSILNGCYDNAYINDENRIAYAFMMKQGIIPANYDTKPDSILTREECELLVQTVHDRFVKEIAINISGSDIVIGSNISSVINTFGLPNRIDKTEYGFEWYVYNSDYLKFFMVGVEADRVCALFSNGTDFNLNGIHEGSDLATTAEYADNRCFRFCPTPDGKVDAILYNSAYRSADNSAAVKRSKSMILLDMINANRSKHMKPIYAEDEELCSDAWLSALSAAQSGDTLTQSGFDVFSVYGQLVSDESEILKQDTQYVTPLGINSRDDMSGSVTATIKSDTTRIASPPEREQIELPEESFEVNEPYIVTAPVILLPQTETKYDEGDDIVIELEYQAAARYHIEMFDVENDEYVVNEYVVTDDTQITLPQELFAAGRDYRLVLSSLTSEGESLSADEVLISYGSAYDTGVEIVTPYNEGILDGDDLEITWQSDKYHDFSVELYNQEGELVASKVVEGEQEALIQGLDDGGQYSLYVSALRRGTKIEKAQDMVTFTVQLPEPVINEIILDRDDKYYYVYEDEAMGLLYFYDEELVEVEDEDGETVTKKKIIQKQVKSTRGYRKLASKRTEPAFTTGDPFSPQHSVAYDGTIGEAIVSEAEKYLGVDYVWGGETPDGFDCSGLVKYVMATLGININRVAEDQFTDGAAVNRDELQPGDLVFFEQNGYIHHVGIYAGDGMMIHAPRTGDVVKYQSIDTDYYRSEYAGARRVY